MSRVYEWGVIHTALPRTYLGVARTCTRGMDGQQPVARTRGVLLETVRCGLRPRGTTGALAWQPCQPYCRSTCLRMGFFSSEELHRPCDHLAHIRTCFSRRYVTSKHTELVYTNTKKNTHKRCCSAQNLEHSE